MSHPAPLPGNGPWRLLILDRDPADPKWILTMVIDPGDVRPTQLWAGRHRHRLGDGHRVGPQPARPSPCHPDATDPAGCVAYQRNLICARVRSAVASHPGPGWLATTPLAER